MADGVVEKVPTRGFHVIQWIEAHCIFASGEWVGRPFVLLPWQKKVLLALFQLDPETGLRAKRWAYISVAKKNGKTELAAALALYFLIGDGEPAPVVCCAASSEEQADLVFGAARRMVELSPTLSQVIDCFDRELLVKGMPGAKLQRVAAAAGTNDGKNIHAVICDELHEWVGPRGEAVWNVLTNSTGARRQPMVVQITTAGFDVEGTICGRQYEHAHRVLDGVVEDPAFYAFIAEAPDEDLPLLDDEALRAANPSYGVTVHYPFFADQSTKKTQAVFRRYFHNRWTRSDEIWEVADLWKSLLDKSVVPDTALPTYVMIDLALRRDSAAVVLAQSVDERIVLRAKIWANPYPADHALYASWHLNEAEVENYLRALYDEYRTPTIDIDGTLRPGPAFFYDPMYMERTAQVLGGDGLAMVEWGQDDSKMVPAAQTFFELAKKGMLAHDGDPAFARQIANVMPVEKPKGWRISKPKGSRRHIDAAVAAAVAAYHATTSQPVEPIVLVPMAAFG